MQTKEKNIFEYTNKKLKALIQNNEDFNKELATAYEFYKTRLLQLIKDEDTEKLESELFSSIKSQIFNGYFIALEFLGDEETKIEDEWFKQSEGMIAQQLPDILRNITGNKLEEIITYDSLKNLSSWLIKKYEGVYPLLMDISLNTACIGAKWALKDEGEKRGAMCYQPRHKGILADLDEVTYINPQTYINTNIVNESAEVWDIINSNYIEMDKIGEAIVLKTSSEDKVEGRFYLSVNFKNTLSNSNQDDLIHSLLTRLMVINEVERDHLIVTAAAVEEFYYFTDIQ
ncbi:hypothetical protein [Mesobacillus zeae]|uniref:hypothetical protein n=1 Tax=Mesobacillus zeae TaxID=1917180 RepID=UPI00300830AF